DRHLGRSVGGPVELLYFAGGKREAGVRTKAHRFLLGPRESSDLRAVRAHRLNQAHSLKEPEFVRPATQRILDQSVFQRIICLPARGGHSCRSSLLWRVLTTSWLKLFRLAYCPRKNSSTLANRYTPPPTNWVS